MTLAGELGDDRVKHFWAHHPALIEQDGRSFRRGELSLQLSDPPSGGSKLGRFATRTTRPNTTIDFVLGFPAVDRGFAHLQFLGEVDSESPGACTSIKKAPLSQTKSTNRGTRQLIYRKSMGPNDSISLYESLIGDIALEFWNEILTGVEVRDTFVLNGTELLGAHFNDVRHLIERQPRLANDAVSLSATFDVEDMTWFMTTDWYITSVTVEIDPDTLP